jgi:hypothetical protein
MPRWKLINEALGMGIPEPPETYSTSEHLFEALDIPAGVKGSLPRAERGRAGLDAEELEDIGETGKARSPRRPARRPDEGSRSDQGPRTDQPRKTRVRKRTRSGVSVRGTDTAQPDQAPPAKAEGSADAPPRRRRRRSGRGRKDSTAS